ncbi:hypothetical protein PPERSA_09798 [Pseudocohnilembus persalinus]|uniref:Ubiquitin-like domain-containing protein n=1 Tax=Pseudocohnilembus persalinus TaxID=266149 RepID=A0A0V0QUF3_PSEPJ|nr:hypothetical protein PPERSA_09798 [Pseudocohnilembus persalinus]|eukprot:KRX05658.1 hypothetical protein PPERSA_09798 [Pseudocohnilembus persalinus]
MPIKKGKKGKKKKGKKKKVKEYLPLTYNIPEYEDPKIYTPKVDLIIKLASPPNEIFNQTLEQVPISTRVAKIVEQIKKMHQGCVSSVSISKDKYDPEEAMDHDKTLQECGIVDGEIKLFYDYKPITNPLLV